MTLLAPIWLWLLLPWVVIYVWRGRGSTRLIRVPFLAMWPTAAPVAGPRRRPPPLWAILLLAATLFAILAAAGPALVRPAQALTIIVDRGPSLSGERLRSAIARLPISPGTRVRVLPLPGDAFDDVGGMAVDQIKPTARPADTALRQALADAVGPIVVISDRAIDVPTGVSVVRPDRPLVNTGIDLFAVTPRSSPAAGTGRPASGPAGGQAMVRLFNSTDRRRAIVRVDGSQHGIDLPPAGRTGDYLFDLPTLSETAEAELLTADGARWADDVAGDDRAYLARVAAPARIEPRLALPDTLARMVAVYNHRRAARAGDAAIAVVDGGAPSPGGAAVMLADRLTAPPADGGAAGGLSIDTDHPVTRSANLIGLVAAGRSLDRPPGDGWRVLVRASDTPLIAVRDRPARQVWVGVDFSMLATQSEYVVFWTDAFDWLAGGRVAYAAETVREGLTAVRVADASLDASPGLYRDDRDGGRTLATAMPAVRPGPVGDASPAFLASVGTVPVALASWLLAVALVLLTAGLLLGRRLTGF